jgi:hypothetical protein
MIARRAWKPVRVQLIVHVGARVRAVFGRLRHLVASSSNCAHHLPSLWRGLRKAAIHGAGKGYRVARDRNQREASNPARVKRRIVVCGDIAGQSVAIPMTAVAL